MNEIIKIALEADAGSMVKAFREADGAMAKFASGAKSMAKIVQSAGTAVKVVEDRIRSMAKRAIASGASVSASFAGMSISAGKFQTEMLNIQSIARLSQGDFENLGNSLLDASRKLPQSAEVIAQGFYDIQSAGFAGADGLYIAEEATKAASAGQTQMAVSAKAVTTVLNAYGLEAGRAGDISDILFKTVDLGVVTFEELATGMGDWIGMTQAAGIAADQGASAIAAMTLSGMNASEAGTSLSRVMQEFIDPGEQLKQLVSDLGYESALSMLQQEGLSSSVMMITDAVDGETAAFTQLFPEIRAARGMMALAANDGENFARVSSEITDETARAGATNKALAIILQGMNAKWNIFKNNVRANAIELGSKLVPAITLALEAFIKIAQVVGSIPGPIKTMIAFGGALAGVLTLIVGIAGLFIAKGIVWRFVLNQVAIATTVASGANTVYATTLGLISRGAASAATSNGVLGASFKAVSAGAGAASGAMGLSAAAMAGAALGVVGLAVGIWAVKSASDAAHEAGVNMAKTFSDELNDDSMSGMVDKANKLAEELVSAREAAEGQSTWKVWSNDLEKAYGYLEGIQHEADLARWQVENLEQAMLSVYLNANKDTTGLNFQDDFYPDGDHIPEVFAMWQDELGVTKEVVLSRMAAIADAFDIDPNLRGIDFARELTQAMNSLDSGTAAAEGTSMAIEKLGDTAQTTGDRISGLHDVMMALYDQAFGMDEATDRVTGSINDIYLAIEGMREAGSLDDALALGSKHEDALKLRDDMRGLTQDIIAENIEWAKTQENLTGAEFLAHLGDSADAMMDMGLEAGLTREFMQDYVDLINSAAANKEIAVKFNEGDLAAMSFVTDAIIADLGLIPAEVDTAINIYKDDGEAALAEYMESLGLADDADVQSIITVATSDALTRLQEFADARGLATEDVMALIETGIKNPEDLPALLDSLALADSDYEAIVGIVGAADSDLLVSALELHLTNLTGEDWEATVDADGDPAIEAINSVQAKLDAIDGSIATVTIIGNVFSTARPSGDVISTPEQARIWAENDNANGNVYEAFANGGVSEQHIATIAGGRSTVRKWAEPETMGEAYIPLSPAKRRRSERILREVARRFDLQVYADGGIYTGGDDSDGGFSGRTIADRFRKPQTTASSGGSSGGSGSGGGGSSTSKAEATMANRFAAGDVSIDEYLAYLRDLAAGHTKYTDDWSRAINEAEDLVKGRNEIMLELNELSEMDYIAFLDGRIATEEKYTDDWWSLTNERQALQEDMADRQRGVEKMMLDLGIMSEAEYKKTLQNRLANLRQFTDEWYKVWKELASFQVDMTVDVEKAQKRYDDALEKQLASQEAYNKAVADQSKQLRTQIAGELAAARAVVTGPIEALANATQHFGGELSTSREEILEYYRHVTEGARRYQSTMQRLEEGGLADTLLEQLYAAGPEALNMATAFEEMIQSGQINEVNALANEIESIANQTGDFYMSTRGKSIVDAFGVEESTDWMGDFGVSLDYVNDKVQDMALNFSGVTRALEAVEIIAKEVADALKELDSVKLDKSVQDAKNDAEKQGGGVTETPVEALYQELFGRSADSAGNSYWTGLYSGGMSLDVIRDSMKQSPEYINTLYNKLFGRDADDSGYAYWSQVLASGVTGDMVEMMMKESPEYKNRKQHGGLLASGRSAFVGENGPEIFRAPAGGALIYPTGHGQSGGEGVTIGSITIGAGNNLSKRDVQDAIDQSFKKVKRTAATGSRR